LPSLKKISKAHAPSADLLSYGELNQQHSRQSKQRSR